MRRNYNIRAANERRAPTVLGFSHVLVRQSLRHGNCYFLSPLKLEEVLRLGLGYHHESFAPSPRHYIKIERIPRCIRLAPHMASLCDPLFLQPSLCKVLREDVLTKAHQQTVLRHRVCHSNVSL